jgi:hypothetical protein
VTGATVTGRLLGEKKISLQATTVITDPTASAIDITVSPENFNTNKSSAYYGATTGFSLTGTTLSEIASAKVELYDASNNLLVTNTFKSTFLPTLRAGGAFSSSFRVKTGTYTTSSSQTLGVWTPSASVKPAKMLVTITDSNGDAYTATNLALSETTATWESLFIPNSIAITTPATKLSYTVGDALDLSGLVVTGTYPDLTTVETITNANVSGFNSASAANDQVLTITVGSSTASYTVDIVAKPSSGGSSGSRARRATPAIPAIPGISPAIPAIPSINSSRTVSASLFTFVRDLSLGSEGNDVTELQKRLTAEGVYSGPITGYFGPLTLEGVKAYQRKMGISDTGYVGPLTKAALNRGDNSRAEQIASIKLQLISLIRQLIEKLQAELDAK